jgi:hypothetical protein
MQESARKPKTKRIKSGSHIKKSINDTSELEKEKSQLASILVLRNVSKIQY